MSFKSFRPKPRSKRAAAVPVPPPVESPAAADRPRRKYLRWVVVLVLGTGIAAARLYYPDVLDDTLRLAAALWPPRAAVEPTPVAASTPSPTPPPAPPTEVPVAASMGTVDTRPRSPVEHATDTDMASPPPMDWDAAADAGLQIQAAALAPGTQMTGRAQEPYVTFWSYPGTSTGHRAVHRYAVSTVFEVVEPDRTSGDYPVELDGVSWLRVQAADGLVGWVKSSELEEAGGAASR